MRQKMTFKEVLEKYRQLLQAHPGKDLIIADGNAAVMEGGEVYGAPLKLDGTLEFDSLYDFDANAFLADEGRWDGESSEQLQARILFPAFISIESIAE
ncbi:hypothetical protein [Pseudomonas veronii]|jgi:hypothetical protein|uniref:Uncharacterized protein n=1 Tax=Pseudomonas veronii TaxID=76761 RepID=A0A7Y1AD60_PSEVE|nr:hypothetical protein [Pseudomonas veronii]NMX54201.1 hypothetical protein [Pseudomonas veronii]NMY13593.1 hypothetical protein [Pseudomonas veronii]